MTIMMMVKVMMMMKLRLDIFVCLVNSYNMCINRLWLTLN